MKISQLHPETQRCVRQTLAELKPLAGQDIVISGPGGIRTEHLVHVDDSDEPRVTVNCRGHVGYMYAGADTICLAYAGFVIRPVSDYLTIIDHRLDQLDVEDDERLRARLRDEMQTLADIHPDIAQRVRDAGVPA